MNRESLANNRSKSRKPASSSWMA